MPAAIADRKTEIAQTLATAVRAALARRDTGHVAFHGCIDWHSAVHGTWALTAYTRMTGDRQHVPLVAEVLRADKIAAERAVLGSRPDFEMPYGRAWFLRLALEHGRTFGSTELQPMADDLLASLLAHYAARAPDPRSGSYQSASWALINMHDYAARSQNASALETVRSWIERHFVPHDGACDYTLEHGHFMGVATNWAWLVSRVLEQDAFDRWAQAFFAEPGLPQPVTQPVTWHHHGLNFSRAWGLWGLQAASGSASAKAAYLAAYAAHFRATYDEPELWCGSYKGVGHWVPQFGMLALQPLFDTDPVPVA
ncbi:MAG: DUF2891 domain-containing protein [Hyphomonadaceae bacterium]|nr:DUF2891 domain-containing protein [Hyphomonadaceae bacterium]